MLGTFFHYNICVRDMQRSLEFYRRLGFVARDDVTPEGDDITPHLGVSAKKLRAVILVLEGDEDSPMLDLVEFIDPPTAGEPYPTLANVGIARVSFEVADFDASLRKLEAIDVRFVGPAVSYVAPDGSPRRTRCFHDPDGVVLQIIGAA
jgi:catechol 2,3-dioxygenase-like lactoylglutathione lyase family enzyme